jgi:hypothetical protein
VLDLAEWMESEFGVEIALYPFVHAPPEPLFPEILSVFLWFLRMITGRAKKRYPSLKLRNLVEVVHAGKWPELSVNDLKTYSTTC